MKLLSRIWNWFGNAEQITPSQNSLELHERFPEILEWKEGDQFDEPKGYLAKKWKLIAVCSDGTVYVWNDDYPKHKEWWDLEVFVKKTRNLDARERRLTERLKNSQEYMVLISDFQRSVEELRQRDIERIGEPIQDVMVKAASSVI